MMPEDGLDTLAACDEMYLGAVGRPTVPDHLSLGTPAPHKAHFAPGAG
jgi:hypothetical protein